MAQLPAALNLSEEDVKMMLACQVHLGTRNCDANMARYVYKRRGEDGSYSYHYKLILCYWLFPLFPLGRLLRADRGFIL